MSIVVGVPASVVDLQQKGLLERAFHDGLFPTLAYRSECLFEDWEANSGTEIFMSRPGLLAPKVNPLQAGVDPTPEQPTFEQWSAVLQRYGSSIDTHIPTSVVSNANLFLRNIQTIGLQAGQSVNRIARNAMFKAYLGGQTATTAIAAAGDSTIAVASLNGFTEVLLPTASARPVPVSPANPLSITIAGVTGARNVIGTAPNDPNDPQGPGILFLSAALGGAGAAARASVLAANRPRIVRTGGGTSVDALGAADTFVLQDAINAVALLRRASVQPHSDGWYHAHISPQSNAQVFSDPAFQRLNTSLPEYAIYKEGFIGTIAGIMFYMNNESPDETNTGVRIATGTNAFYSPEIGAETTNDAGINVGRILITGRGVAYERGLNPDLLTSEAGITGKVGEFQVVNNGISISTEKIRLTLRSPINRLQDQVAATWDISTSFPIPSDQLASSGPERFKRAIVLEHALLSSPCFDKTPVPAKMLGIGVFHLLNPGLERGSTMARNKAPVQKVDGSADGLPDLDAIEQGIAMINAQQNNEPDSEERAKQLAQVPKPKQYQAMNSGWIMDQGCKVAVRAGKIFTEHQYDIKRVASQGIILKEIELCLLQMMKRLEFVII